MKTIILFCPGADPILPHAAPAALGARLKEDGNCRYELRDLNLEAFLYFLTEKRLSAAMKKVAARTTADQSNNIDPAASSTHNLKEFKGFPTPQLEEEARHLLKEFSHLPHRIESSTSKLREAEYFYNTDSFLKLRSDIDAACRLISLQYDRIDFKKYSVYTHTYDTFHEIRNALDDPDARMMAEFYNDTIIPQIKKEKPEIVGISTAYFSQLIPSFQLAELIRQASPDTHIILGGPVITWGKATMVREAGKFATLMDSFCTGEGETCLSQLVEAIKNKKGLKGISNLVYFQKGTAVINPQDHSDTILKSPRTPDYAGMPINNYLAPQRVLSMQLTKGCYFNGCRFCNYAFIKLGAYRECPPDIAVRNIAAIVKETGERVFSFESDVISGKYLKAFARRLLDRNVRIKWHACTRFEKHFDRELFDLIAKAGCLRLYIGLESGNQKTLDRMNKGIKVKAVERILGYCRDAGISVEVGVFVGYPGETVEDANVTLDFVRQNRNAINRLDPGAFRMLKGADIEKEIDTYNITLKKDRDHYWYTMEAIDPAFEAQKDSFMDILDQIKRMYPVLAAMDVSEEILYLAKYGYGIATKVGDTYAEKVGWNGSGDKVRTIYY